MYSHLEWLFFSPYMSTENHLPVTLKLRIDWCDLDQFKHVNNVMFFKYIQSARVQYWELCGLSDIHDKKGWVALLLSTNCRFIKPLYYPGEVTIKTGLSFIKNTSFGLKHQLYNMQQQLVAESEDVMVLFDPLTEQKIGIPESVRKTINELEKA